MNTRHPQFTHAEKPNRRAVDSNRQHAARGILRHDEDQTLGADERDRRAHLAQRDNRPGLTRGEGTQARYTPSGEGP